MIYWYRSLTFALRSLRIISTLYRYYIATEFWLKLKLGIGAHLMIGSNASSLRYHALAFCDDVGPVRLSAHPIRCPFIR